MNRIITKIIILLTLAVAHGTSFSPASASHSLSTEEECSDRLFQGPGRELEEYPERLYRLYFDYNSAEVTAGSDRYFETDELGNIMADCLVQMRDKFREITIRGFTDTQGPEWSNYILSRKRAHMVRDLLVNEYGYDPATIDAVWGFGEDYPTCEEDTEECHAANRVVQIVFRDLK